MTLLAALVAAAVLLPSCSRKPARRYVERVEVEGETVEKNAVMALTPLQVQAVLESTLGAHSGFEVLKGRAAPEGAKPYRVKLVLEFTRESQKESRPGTWAEVGATLTVRGGVDELARYDLVGLGEVKVPGDSLDERQASVRKALEAALEQAVASASLQLAAVDKADPSLVKDLKDPDPRVREFAVRVLAERKNPAAAEPLLERLKNPHVDEVRRAIGGLIELKDPRAVPALIDLAREKDLMFLREIIYALGAIGGEEAEAYLYTVAQGHDQPAIRMAAQQALDELTAQRARESNARTESGKSPGRKTE
ncbi:MAG: HEAT repeat domain-containing protein [Myxococcaceae bacterium]